MKTQIAIRLPEEQVAFLDSMVEQGLATSRAAAVSKAIESEKRRIIAARDIAILKQTEPDEDLNALARHGSRIEMEDLD